MNEIEKQKQILVQWEFVERIIPLCGRLFEEMSTLPGGKKRVKGLQEEVGLVPTDK